MKKVFIPSAILTACKAAGLEGSDYFCNQRLLNILSPEDVAFYYYVNLQSSQFLPTEMDLSFENYLLCRRTLEGAPWERIENEQTRKDVNRLINDYCVANQAPQSATVSPEMSSELLFVTGEIEPILLFTDVPETTTDAASVAARLRAFYTRVMMQATQFRTIAELAKLPIFAGYLQSSANALKAV
jgi:hypothetical protein